MRHFQKLGEGAAVLASVHTLMRRPALWDTDRSRTTLPNSPHAQAHDVILRAPLLEQPTATDALVGFDNYNRDVFAVFPELREIAFDLMRSVRGTRLGRVILTRLEPGNKITEHADIDEFAASYDRYHIVLQGLPGSLFVCGDESVQMLSGEIWWFDMRTLHYVINNSKDDRIHMVVDIHIDP